MQTATSGVTSGVATSAVFMLECVQSCGKNQRTTSVCSSLPWHLEHFPHSQQGGGPPNGHPAGPKHPLPPKGGAWGREAPGDRGPPPQEDPPFPGRKMHVFFLACFTWYV